MRKTQKFCLRFTAWLMILAMLLPAFPLITAEAANEPEAGIYRIKNAGTGLYIGVYKYYYKYASTARVFASALNTADTGESISLESAGNGCWRLIPQNDNCKYAICCEAGTSAGAQVSKTAVRNEDSLWDITEVSDGYYTIAPSCGDNMRAVLAVGNENSGVDWYLEVEDYTYGNQNQLWIFEPISTTGLTVAYTQTTLKLYSTGTFYAALQPSGTSADKAEWTSSDENVLMIGNDGSYCALGAGKTTVTVAADGHTASFDVTVCDSDCFTWYSQNSVSGSDWDATQLTNQFWYSDGTYKRYMWDGKANPSWANWMDTGCAICSIAMVLHNMGAVMTEGYDLRTGQSGGLSADPYTVSLASSVNKNVTSVSKTVYGNPSLVAWKYVSDAFTVDGEAMSYRKIYNPSRATIAKLLKTHPQGIIAQLTRGSGSHYVVISGCTNEGQVAASKYEFTIFDPAAYLESEGRDVSFAKSTSAIYMYYTYYSIDAVIIYDTVSNINN